MTQAGWHPDPTGRHQQRYWDGTGWTEHVVDQGTQSTDPTGAGVPQPTAVVPPTPPGYGQPAGYAPYGVAPSGLPPSGKKVPAGICGILLGALGIHKFILGYTGEGLTMLLVSIFGGIVTCGVATAVMSVIGLIEGIMYLTKSDQEFDATYVYSKRGWF